MGVTAPRSCTSSCLRHGTQGIDVTLDRNRKIVRLQTRFQSTQVKECVTADCGGAPKAEFGLGRLEPGHYRVSLGKRPLGTLKVPLEEARVCLGISDIYQPNPRSRSGVRGNPTVAASAT